jgi:hypothetical protein
MSNLGFERGFFLCELVSHMACFVTCLFRERISVFVRAHERCLFTLGVVVLLGRLQAFVLTAQHKGSVR